MYRSYIVKGRHWVWMNLFIQEYKMEHFMSSVCVRGFFSFVIEAVLIEDLIDDGSIYLPSLSIHSSFFSFSSSSSLYSSLSIKRLVVPHPSVHPPVVYPSGPFVVVVVRNQPVVGDQSVVVVRTSWQKPSMHWSREVTCMNFPVNELSICKIKSSKPISHPHRQDYLYSLT